MRCPDANWLVRSHLKLSLYWSNRDLYLAANSHRRLTKKLEHVCLDCPAQSLPDNERCQRCRDAHVEACSSYWSAKGSRRRRKMRAEARRDLNAYRAVDEVVDLTRVRLLRATRFLDWFATSDLNENLGIVDVSQRNTVTMALSRMARAGLFERRRSQGPVGLRGNGAHFEYRITQAGRDELASILSGTRAARVGRRAA